MPTNQILDKHAATTQIPISLGSLASSTAGAGRQGDLQNNSVTRYPTIILFVKVKLGTSPTGNRQVYVHLLRGDVAGTENIKTDGCGDSDANLTVKNAQLIGTMFTGSSPSTGDVLQGDFVIDAPGPEWGVAIVHDTGVNLDATNGNHDIRYIGVNPDIQAAA